MIGLKRDCWQSFGPTQVPLGDCAAVRVGGVEVVLITNRTQALGLELFTNLGIDPTQRKHRGGEVDQPLHGGLRADRQEGDLRRFRCAAGRDYRKIPYTRVQRPIWPLDADTKPGLIF